VLPISILYKLTLNDLFIIGDMKYKISTARVDLTTGKSDIEIFTDYSLPADYIANLIPLTVDNTFITVDNTNITVDAVYSNPSPVVFLRNEISPTNYDSTKAKEIFEIKVTANGEWTATPDSAWITLDKDNGNKTGYIRVTLSENTSSFRSGSITIMINAEVFVLTITQE
jgi:hypothetical protein